MEDEIFIVLMSARKIQAVERNISTSWVLLRMTWSDIAMDIGVDVKTLFNWRIDNSYVNPLTVVDDDSLDEQVLQLLDGHEGVGSRFVGAH